MNQSLASFSSEVPSGSAGTPQTQVQQLLDQLTSRGIERGLQVAAYVNGKLVVSAWSGVADAATGTPVDEGTLFPVFSTTKGMMATIIHQLAERGLLTYEQPVSAFWPEFGANGKQGITLRQVLNHSSGIPQMPRELGVTEVCDWDLVCAKIAALPPAWPPGTRIEYHPMTYGWILGEVARRITGRTVNQLVQDDICWPLGIDSMFVGIPDEVESRVAILEEPDAVQPVDDGQLIITVPVSLGPLYSWMNRPDARRACIPASNGIMNAVAIARHYAALLPGGVDGVELLPPERVRIATEPQKPDHPDSDDFPKNRVLGYEIGGEGDGWNFGHGGYGGSKGFAEPKLNLAIGFTKNLFHKEETGGLIVRKLREAVIASR